MEDKNKYEYLDPDYIYTDKATGVMKNLLGITDKEQLHIAEHRITAGRESELLKRNPKVKSLNEIQKIHKHLFQDIYMWAGHLRTVDISKETLFFPVSRFANATLHLNGQITKCRACDKNDRQTLAMELAKALDTLNHFHPFREGNGRAQRLAMRLLAREKGYDLDLNPPKDPKVYEAYMKGTIEGDAKLLAELMAGCLEPMAR